MISCQLSWPLSSYDAFTSAAPRSFRQGGAAIKIEPNQRATSGHLEPHRLRRTTKDVGVIVEAVLGFRRENQNIHRSEHDNQGVEEKGELSRQAGEKRPMDVDLICKPALRILAGRRDSRAKFKPASYSESSKSRAEAVI